MTALSFCSCIVTVYYNIAERSLENENKIVRVMYIIYYPLKHEKINSFVNVSISIHRKPHKILLSAAQQRLFVFSTQCRVSGP